MSLMKTTFCALVASSSLAACSTMDGWDPSQRNAAIGGALGAAAGAAVADDDLSGALIGGPSERRLATIPAARNRAAALSAANRSPRATR